jgi:N-acetylglucosamine malate deacetylase 1
MVALAVGCHPDDIEFMMSGTLFLLRDAGWEVHYVNLANGSCGTDRYPTAEIIRIRGKEAREAASELGAVFHDSFVNDLEVFYEQELIRKVAGLVREVKPSIVLTQSLEDYMEDHMNTARVTVTAAFCRGMLNYGSIPERPLYGGDLMIYHSTPHILSDAMRRPVVPEMFVDVGS